MCKVQRHVVRQRGTSGKQVKLDGGLEAVVGQRQQRVGGTASRDIMRHRTAGQESGAAGRHSGVAGDAVVQPEGAAEG